MKEMKISNKVYEKDFSIKALGYSCEEVDKFLDTLNVEIVKLERELESLNAEKQKLSYLKNALEQDNSKLKKENYTLRATNNVTTNNNANFSNIDLLNRIAHLETMVQQLLDKKED